MKKLLSLLAIGAIVLGMTSCGDGNDPEQQVIKGKFTVDKNGKQVQFSKGNLQAAYDGSKWTWAFAEHQWDYVGNAAANNAISGNGTVSTNGTVDLFCWSTPATYYGIHKTNLDIYSGDFEEWGKNIGEGWYTLSEDEWVYLLHGRDKADELFGFGSVNGITGLIILPDDWTLPNGATFNSAKDKNLVWNNEGNSYKNSKNDNFSHNIYYAKQWDTMEKAGAVFLPAAGVRYVKNVTDVGSRGCYWTSTPTNEDTASDMYFASTSISITGLSARYGGLSVRLVREVK